MEVGIFEVDGGRPIPRANGLADVLDGVHPEVKGVQPPLVEPLEVEDGFFGTKKTLEM
jgi:hypothetical protein